MSIKITIDNIVKKNLDSMARDAEMVAKASCPVRTGNLRSSIKVQRKKYQIVLSSDVDYALYVEYGTRFMPAQPFLRRAKWFIEEKLRAGGYSNKK